MSSTTSNTDVAMWEYHQIQNAESFGIGHGRQDALFKRAGTLLDRGKVLEIGFGDGYLLGRLSRKFECFGADISPQNVRQMAERYPGVSFDVISANGKLPHADGSIDLFIASEVLEHMDDAELARATSEIHRVLKPRGHALITFPARENLADSTTYCPGCGLSFHKWGHKQSWDRDKIQRVFRDFRIDDVEEIYFTGAGLNAIGRLEALLRTALSKVRQVSGMTFMVTLTK